MRRLGAGEDFELGVFGVVDVAAVGAVEGGEVSGGGCEGLAVTGGADKHELVMELVGEEEQQREIHGGASLR